ncbi:MAG: DoxX family protein [Candidatus Methylacidiphilales bacterium]
MADPLPEFSDDDPLIAEADRRTGPQIQRTTTAEWVLGARLLAGAPLLYYGFVHATSPWLLRDMMIASQVPAPALLTYIVAPLELIAGIVLLVGAYARIAAGGGALLMGFLVWLTWTCLTLRDGYMPPGVTEPPPTPPITFPPVFLLACIIIAITGAGPMSVDEYMTRPEPPPPPDPNAPPTGII